MSNCRTCRHSRRDHEHYRTGTDCGRCDCRRFTRDWFGDLRTRLRRTTARDDRRTGPPRTSHGNAA